MVRVLHVLKTLYLESLPVHVFLYWLSSKILLVALFPRIWILSIFLSTSLENVRLLGFGWSVQVSLYSYDYLVLHRHSPDWTDIPNSAEDCPSRCTGCITLSWRVSPSLERLVSVSPWVNLHWKSLLDLSLTWRSAFRSDQKENCWNGYKRRSRNSFCWTNEEDGSTRHVWNSLWLTSLRVDFGCQHIWFGPLVPSWFCRTTNQAQLCGYWTRVSSLDFWPLIIMLMTASLSSKNVQLRCVGGYVIHNWQLLILSLSLSSCALVMFLLMEWSPVTHKSPWASLLCLAVLCVDRNTSITMSQRSRASSPSMRNPVSKEMISDSADLWDTDVCFLHIQLMVTKCSASENT